MMEPQPKTICVDRLSTLPDELLHMILYFLPSPQVVQTCVLSKRWRGLWRSTPYVDIDCFDLGITITEDIHDLLEERWGKFENFATNLLLFHECTSSLDEFRFSSYLYNRCHVDRWIRRGIEYCPAVIQIEILGFYDHGRFKLPPVAGSSFRHLKTLSLSNLDLNNHFGDLLCSACPVLEDLVLNYCEFCDNYSQGITSPTLNYLLIRRCSNYSSHPLVIMAPRLADLSLIFGCYQAGILLYHMDSLVDAEIYIDDSTFPQQENIRALLGNMFNVTDLYLRGFEAKMMLNGNPDKFPVFHNMRTLCLESCFLNGYELNDKLESLWSFCQNAPCLEKLTLRLCMCYSFKDSTWEEERKNITLQQQHRNTIQCHKLKLIEVQYDCDHDHQLIELVWSLGRSVPDARIKLCKKPLGMLDTYI